MKKVINENQEPKIFDINTYTKEKLLEDITKCEKAITKLTKIITNYDFDLTLKKDELEELKKDLAKLNGLKNFIP